MRIDSIKVWRANIVKIAIFHDYIGAIGGGEKLVLTLARGLGADVITTDVDEDSIKKMGFEDMRIISLGETNKIPPLKQISASLRFALCDFSKNYDFLYFLAHFAARRHKPNFLANLRNSSTNSAGASPRPHGCAALWRRGQVSLFLWQI